MKYRFLSDVTSDVVFESYGKTIEELLINSATAMFSVICDIKKVKKEKEIGIEVEAQTLEELVYNWLSKLLTLSEINCLFLSKFDINEIKNFSVKGKAYGEEMTKEKGGTVVKGVSFHNFSVSKTKKGYKAKVTLDI